MIVKHNNGLTYYQFENLAAPGLKHGIFTRLGGVSKPPWNSLNLGGTVGDDPAAVKENLSRLVKCLDSSISQLAQVRQIHSSKVIKVDIPGDATERGDAIISNRPGLVLMMRFADCVPLLYFDPTSMAVAIAHAGWQGTLKGVAAETVREMTRHFGTKPEDLFVGIGPSIGPDHYQIGPDVQDLVQDVYPDRINEVLVQSVDSVKFDLWKANQIKLEEAGVKRIEVASICTGCDLAHWYSHRAENGKTGRFAAVIGMEEA